MTDVEQCYVHVLWASNDRYPPQFITAWPDGLVDAWHDWYLELRERAESDYRNFATDDGPWAFWTTAETVPRGQQGGLEL